MNKRSSFESALTTILDHKKASSIDHVGSKMPIILVGTKTDLSGSSESPKNSGNYVSESEQRNRAERYNVTLNVSTDNKFAKVLPETPSNFDYFISYLFRREHRRKLKVV